MTDGVPPVLQAASLKQGDKVAAKAGDASRRSACIAGGLIEAGLRSETSTTGHRGVPPVLQAASLKHVFGAVRSDLRRRRSACIAGGLIEATVRLDPLLRRRWRSACIAGGLIEARSIRHAIGLCAAGRSACIAGGLIEAEGRTAGTSRPRGVPPVLQAASLKRDAVEGTSEQGLEGVPPVLQAASLKHCRQHQGGDGRGRRSACIAGGLIEAPRPLWPARPRVPAFRLYCRRPH